MTYDAAAFGALALALTVLGGIVTWFRWRTHGLPALLSGTAWSLLPVAAWLSGVLRLLVEVGSSVGRWATRLVFSPTVWTGVALGGAAVVLFVLSSIVKDRGKPAVEEPARRKQVKGKPAVGDEDMDDIAAILRKHGIQ